MEKPKPEFFFKYYTVQGENLERVPYTPAKNQPFECKKCGVPEGELHLLGCSAEKAVCYDRKHKRMINCTCNLKIGEPV
jgi:hypothetical protein